MIRRKARLGFGSRSSRRCRSCCGGAGSGASASASAGRWIGRRAGFAVSHQIEGWSEFDLGGWLRQLAGAPVVVENDANVAALGEALCGAGVGFNPVFYVTLGSGVGGGLVVDGRIYHGAKPGESEIGHVRLDRQRDDCRRRAARGGRWTPNPRVEGEGAGEPAGAAGRPERGGEAKHLAAALQQGDPAAKRLLQEMAEDLAFGLSHAVHLFHPEIIILGGGLSGVGEPLRAGVRERAAAVYDGGFRPRAEECVGGAGGRRGAGRGAAGFGRWHQVAASICAALAP